MKYLVLIVVVLGVLWLLRSRSSGKPPRAGKPTASPGAQPMVSCAHCGVHLPRAEAVAGLEGSYCSEAHRLAHGESR